MNAYEIRILGDSLDQYAIELLHILKTLSLYMNDVIKKNSFTCQLNSVSVLYIIIYIYTTLLSHIYV